MSAILLKTSPLSSLIIDAALNILKGIDIEETNKYKIPILLILSEIGNSQIRNKTKKMEIHITNWKLVISEISSSETSSFLWIRYTPRPPSDNIDITLITIVTNEIYPKSLGSSNRVKKIVVAKLTTVIIIWRIE